MKDLTAGGRRRHKSPASAAIMHDLQIPSMPDHLRAEADGPSMMKRVQSD